MDAIALAQELIRCDTACRNEDAALALVAPLLEDAGFQITTIPWRPGRSNLVATWNGGGPLVLSGHVDTVPYRLDDWSHDPFAAEIHDGRLVGLGSSDMKAGVAAIVCAAVSAARRGASGFAIALTSAEETGCEGAEAVAAAGLLDPGSVFVIGEATGNELQYGHKGATWLKLTAHGRAAHASRPDLGRNAIEALADAVLDLRTLDPGPIGALGQRTTSVGTIEGGGQPNLVPASATMTVDIRTVPESDASPVRELLERHGSVEKLLDMASVWSDPNAAVSDAIRRAISSVTGEQGDPLGAAFFTDASRLDSSRNRSYIIGPGDVDQPHTPNESVPVASVERSVEIYGAVIDALAAHL